MRLAILAFEEVNFGDGQQQLIKFGFVINLKGANLLRITVPPALLAS
jgi:hypothetical protein